MKPKLPPFKKFKQPLLRFDRPTSEKNNRRYFLILAIILGFLIIIVRLFQLTIVKGAYYKHVAQINRIKEIAIPAPRGTIKDRKSFTIAYSEKINGGTENIRRMYNNPEAIAHLIGYIQIADKKDLQSDNCKYSIKLGESIGKLGIEKKYECLLRGIRGKKIVEIDASGKEKNILAKIDPVEGESIQLAIDIELQNKIYEILSSSTIKNSGNETILKEKKAAVVALQPKTGELLALVSTPSFDPHIFMGNQQKTIGELFADETKPMLNRVLDGAYPPGSIFKIFISAAALEQKIIDREFEVEDTGFIEAGPLRFGNWYFLQYGKTEGQVDVIKGIKRSNDIFFYKVGEKMGEKNIRKWAVEFGLGIRTGIGLHEETGTVPSSFWKQETIGEKWFLGDTYNFSIGQGYLLTTPMQIAVSTSVFAQDGQLCKPQLLKNENANTPAGNCRRLPISSEVLKTVREAMKQTCEPGGTGWPFFGFRIKKTGSSGNPIPEIITGTDPTDGQNDTEDLQRISVGCKTGTAESHGTKTLPHAWFVVFAPFEDPEIVLTVMIEEGGEGSSVAAPIAKEILRNYFERRE